MAKAIMIQGTMSSAGKSLLTAGLCRIFRQDGYRVAPFKSQNMALNSFITTEGLEMGRAQVMQCEAAGIEPSVDMNPILLKPNSDMGSQVIVNGEVWGNMSAQEYYRHKKELVPHILKAYSRLAERYDIIVLEGAGSPAEINLKQQDIVNMGMAKLAQAPVLLVGDIDRGGVFASLYGTLALLEPEEQEMVAGLVINKFRGDQAILRPGLSMLEEKTHKPVLGVIPYLSLDIDDEDSLTDRFSVAGGRELIDVAVIRLPRISNFTDFNPLARLEGIGLRYVSAAASLGNPDLIILPGSKNTMEDLLWLRQSGLEALIYRHAKAGGLVLGICGGYQMLGESLSDPYCVEHGGEIRGIGLLPARTVFEQEKTRTQVSGHLCGTTGPFEALGHAPFAGYEIHMGVTYATRAVDTLLSIERIGGEEAERFDGMSAGSVCGCYIHGLFDQPQAAKALAEVLYRRKGLDSSALQVTDPAEYKAGQYDRLADALRAHAEIQSIYRIVENGLPLREVGR